jgi:hypothetical protein
MTMLQAEESINGAQRAALGSGNMDKSQASSLQSRWAREVTAGTRPAAQRPTREQLAAIGVLVVKQPKGLP